MPNPTTNKGYNNPPDGWYSRSSLGARLRNNWDAIDTDFEVPWDLNLQVEGSSTGQTATAAGVQYETKLSRTVTQALVDSNHDVLLTAATGSSAGNEVVTVELFDETAAAVVASVDITGGGQAQSTDISASLTAGNPVHVRYNVTTASATTGATFDAFGALLEIQ